MSNHCVGGHIHTILKIAWSANFKMVWYGPELFGRPSPKFSDFENPLDSDSACLFVYAFILSFVTKCGNACTCIRELKTTEKAELVQKKYQINDNVFSENKRFTD
jgi:hypothetical protein